MANPNINFVKFLRGTQAQYDRLVNKDSNTLYFIYDKTSTEEHPTGKLYLDKFLIGGNSSELTALSLSDLTDTHVGTLTGSEVLQFDNSDNKWKPVLLSSIVAQAHLNTVVKNNITKDLNETDIDAIQRAFNNTSAPGDIGILTDGSVYISNADNSWLKLLDGTIRNLDLTDYIQAGDNRLLTDEQRTKIDNLVIGEDGQIAVSGTINAANVQGLEDFISQHQYISSVDDSIFNVTSAGKLEFKPTYITATTFNSIVGDMSTLLNPISENTTIINEINSIKESVIWQEIQNN